MPVASDTHLTLALFSIALRRRGESVSLNAARDSLMGFNTK